MEITVVVTRQTATVAIPSELVKLFLVTRKNMISLLTHNHCGDKDIKKMVRLKNFEVDFEFFLKIV